MCYCFSFPEEHTNANTKQNSSFQASVTSRDVLIMKAGYPNFLVPCLVNKVRNLETLPVHKHQRIFLHSFTVARLWLMVGESASLLCSKFHEHIPSVVFYNRLKVASSLSLLQSTFGELCSGWGKFSLGFVASLICSKFSDFCSMAGVPGTANPHVVAGSRVRG